jgi:hypothetical protein
MSGGKVKQNVMGNLAGGISSVVDKLANAAKVLVSNWPWGSPRHNLIVDESTLAIDTHYFPSDEGLDCRQYNGQHQFGGEITMTGNCTLEVEQCSSDDPSVGPWSNITPNYELDDGTTGNSNLTVSGATRKFSFIIPDNPWAFIRWKFVPDATTNSIELWDLQKKK